MDPYTLLLFISRLRLKKNAVPTIHLPAPDAPNTSQQNHDNFTPTPRSAYSKRETLRQIDAAMSEALLLDCQEHSEVSEKEPFESATAEKGCQTSKIKQRKRPTRQKKCFKSVAIQFPEVKKRKWVDSDDDTSNSESSSDDDDERDLEASDSECVLSATTDDEDLAEKNLENFDEMKSEDGECYSKTTKYIVFQSALLSLLAVCISCSGINKCYKNVKGTLLTVRTECTRCGHRNEWKNQPLSNETKSSYHMELEGLKRCKEDVSGLNIRALVTDRHRQVSKWVRESWKISHYYDCWHVVKGLTKKLEALAKPNSFRIIKDWIKSIANHLYWCVASSTPGDKEDIKGKWLSGVEHIQNIHDNCYHGSLEREKKWLKPGSEVCERLVDILTKKHFVKDVCSMSALGQTSGLEAFHSLVNQFAPKMFQFSYRGMHSRIYLAALHYNENAGRPWAYTKAGEQRYSIAFPKYKKGGYSLKNVLVKPSYR
ncbi:uncharacterized protein LOC130914917 isoform X2 [Corythoichthys intestinalis]|nr:uncharacterized protein LOC130914917 isoform X2 [Corythoichthys intestinalis]XP_057690493.1 uncharacterized protein LOC130914917 isoform X2 [Corythoichthys intestinalis]